MEIKRYVLVIEDIPESKNISSYEELDMLKDYIIKNNKNKKNTYLMGEAYYNVKNNYASYKRYKKLTSYDSLEKIDSLTTKLTNESELKSYFGIKDDNHSISIAYLYNGVKLTNVFYKNDRKYFNSEFLRLKFVELFQELDFMYYFLSNNKIKSSSKNSYDYYEKLYLYKELRKNNVIGDINILNNFYYSFIKENDYYNYRLLINVIKDYKTSYKVKNKMEYNIDKDYPIFGKEVFLNSDIDELRSKYEDMKINEMNGMGNIKR